MKMKHLQKRINSIFTKHLLIVFITGICIFNIVFGLLSYVLDNAADTIVRKNLMLYSDYLIKDLGDLPDPDRAKELSQQSELDIIYQSPHTYWSTAENYLSIDDLTKGEIKWLDQDRLSIGEYKDFHFFLARKGSETFVFITRQKIFQAIVGLKPVIIGFLLIITVLTGSYYTTRWILLPVRSLKKGVRIISRGDLDYMVPVKTGDELGTLSKAFNDMTSRIRSIMKTKEQLLLDVSHELRSPLTRMKVSLEFLDDGEIKNSLKDDLVEMEKMVTEILETARLHDKSGQLNKKPHDLKKLLYKTAESFMDEKPGLHLKCAADQIMLNIDEDRIETVTRNILSNAFKFSGKNSPPVELSIIEKKDHISITVKDGGIGIPPEALPHVFEPFYRVDSSRTKEISGYGLGLGLCKTIMNAHGGSIDIESNDQSTSVFLRLPTT